MRSARARCSRSLLTRRSSVVGRSKATPAGEAVREELPDSWIDTPGYWTASPKMAVFTQMMVHDRQELVLVSAFPLKVRLRLKRCVVDAQTSDICEHVVKRLLGARLAAASCDLRRPGSPRRVDDALREREQRVQLQSHEHRIGSGALGERGFPRKRLTRVSPRGFR